MLEIQDSKVHFYFLKKVPSLKNRTQLKLFLKKLSKLYKKEIDSLNFIFCSDEYLLEINRNHLQHDFYTDIITFDLSESKLIRGEIYISTDRVKDNAKTFQTSFKEEIHRVIFHGVLHLCGFKDKSKKEAESMRFEEQKALNLYFNN
jgi:rRNA maturation RNase YbeY